MKLNGNTYKSYKESSVLWAKEIPSHWVVEKGKWLFHKNERKVRKEDEVVTCFRDGEVTLRKNRRLDGFTNSLKEHGYQGIRKGDLVIHGMDAFAGSIGISDSDGKSTPVYNVLTERFNGQIDLEYYCYLFRYLAHSNFILSLAKGIRERSTDFRFSDISRLEYVLPPKPEQTAIANFLDDKTAKIDQAISQKERMIELLQERKQIIIQNAVTKGLNPKVKMKDSGVEWIGEIPEHWEVKKLKYVIREKLKYGANESGINYDSNLPRYIRITDFSLNGKLSEKNKLSLSNEVGKNYLLSDGDILFARSGATVGKAYQFRSINSNEKSYAFAGYLIKAAPNPSIILSDYLFYFTQSGSFESWKYSIFNKATIENIGADKYSNLSLTVPPIVQQKKIIEYILQRIKLLNQLIKRQTEQIEKLKEYKTTLIDHAVTGKIKVS